MKFLASRDRPFTSGLTPSSPLFDSDARLSFFSGHATLTASLAAAAGTIGWLRGYRHAWVLWVVGGAIAVGTGLLRIAADKHWFSDVVAGLLVGGGIGIGVPLLFHGNTPPVSVAFAGNGASVTVRF